LEIKAGSLIKCKDLEFGAGKKAWS
jgi:hypothetical protein